MDSHELGTEDKRNSQENELSTNVEIDTIQITESLDVVPEIVKIKDPPPNTSLDREISDVKSDQTIINQIDKITQIDNSPTVNESLQAKLTFEHLGSNEDESMPLSSIFLRDIDSTDTFTSNSRDGYNEATFGEEKSNTEIPSEIRAKDFQRSPNNDETQLQNGTNSKDQKSFLEQYFKHMDRDLNMPSTSGGIPVQDVERNDQIPTNKRSVDQRDEYINDLDVSSSENSSDDDAEKRQRLNDTDDNDNDSDNESDIDEDAIETNEYTDDDDSRDSSNYGGLSDAETQYPNEYYQKCFYRGNMYQVADGKDDCNAMSDSSSDLDNEDDISDSVLRKKPAKSSWSIIKELNSRQLGSNPHFSDNHYKSLNAVKHMRIWARLDGHNGCVNTVEFNQKGNLIASGSDDLNVILWDWAATRKLQVFKSGHKKNVFQAKWMPNDNDLLVTSARDGQVRLLHIPTGKSRRIANHEKSCNKVATHIDTPTIVLSVGEEGRVLQTDIREKYPKTLLCIKNQQGYKVRLYSIASNPLNCNEYCICGDMNEVRIYDKRRNRSPIKTLCPARLRNYNNINITSAVYNYNGTEILASYNEEDIYLFDTSPSAEFESYAHSYRGHQNALSVKGVNFYGPKSEYIVSGSDCRNMFIWEKESEAIVHWMQGDLHGPINCLATHPEFPALATSGIDYNVKIWLPSPAYVKIDKYRLRECIKVNNDKKPQPAYETDLWHMLRCIHWRFAATFLNSQSD